MRLGGLSANADFLKLWVGQSVSVFGNQVTVVALPLTAVLVLDAGAAEMGFLRAAQSVPILLFSLAVGVWIDRVRRKPLVATSNLGRGLFLATIPALALAGALRMEHLYAIAFATGIFEVIFIVAYQAFLPALVRRDELVTANGRLQTSESAAQIAGPGFAGVLVAAVTAPIAIVVDVVTFLVAAACVAWIRVVEPAPAPPRQRSVRGEVREGVVALLGHPVLRPVVLMAIVGVFAFAMYLALIVLYHARGLGLDPVAIGLVFAIGSVGALLGAAAAPALASRLGVGPSLVLGLVVLPSGLLVTALAGGPPPLAATIAATGQFALLFTVSLFNVTVPSLRQTVTPTRLLGRVNATYRFLVWGTVPLGSLAGGAIGEALGLRAPLFAAAAITAAALAGFLLSPVARLRELPAAAEA